MQTISNGSDINAAVGLKLQPQIELEEYKSKDWSRVMVSFDLKTIVFREGEVTSGHFFTALQSSPGQWMLYNSAQMSGPFTLREIQCRYGGQVYGVAYMRSEMLADDGRQSLAQWLADPTNANAARWDMQLALSCRSKPLWLVNGAQFEVYA